MSKTFFVTSVTTGRRAILQSERMAGLLIDVLQQNRNNRRFLLHEFVVMPNHFHLLITPSQDVSITKAVQYVKGGFSFRARRALDFKSEIWQEGFTSHAVNDASDYDQHRNYIRQNPVARFLVEQPELFPYSSAYPSAITDPRPPLLSPSALRHG